MRRHVHVFLRNKERRIMTKDEFNEKYGYVRDIVQPNKVLDYFDIEEC